MTEHPDGAYVSSLLCSGQPAFGRTQRANLWRACDKPVEVSLEEWLWGAPVRNVSVAASVKSSGDDELDWGA
eukprot:3919195-Pyramimonas_sp.AAC.1